MLKIPACNMNIIATMLLKDNIKRCFCTWYCYFTKSWYVLGYFESITSLKFLRMVGRISLNTDFVGFVEFGISD